ncbi:MAG: SBBP repeat-containing protein [Bacteroidetes bacterium]|nr:SBBP repeat-containing protein [Bacteroidota bacterium]
MIPKLQRKNIFLTKYDSSGNVLWAKCAGGTSVNAVSNSVATDLYGNVYITGSFGSSTMIFDSDTLINNGLYNVFTAKYDSTGNVQTLQDLPLLIESHVEIINYHIFYSIPAILCCQWKMIIIGLWDMQVIAHNL